MGSVLTKDVFLEKGKELASKFERLSLPELGGDVFICRMSGDERDAMEERFQGEGNSLVGARAYVAAKTVCDESGVLLFDLDGDCEVLGSIPGSVMTAIFEVSSRINAFTDKDIKDLEKNCESAPSDCSGSK